MLRQLPLELRVAVENLDFWTATEVTDAGDRRMLLATFDEMADRTRSLAEPDQCAWLDHRLGLFRARIDRRTKPRPLEPHAIAAVAKAGGAAPWATRRD